MRYIITDSELLQFQTVPSLALQIQYGALFVGDSFKEMAGGLETGFFNVHFFKRCCRFTR